MIEKRISGYSNYLAEIYSFLAICYLKEPNFVLMTALFEKNIELLRVILEGTELYKRLDLSYADWMANPRFRRKIKEDYIQLFQKALVFGKLPHEACNLNSKGLAKQNSGRDKLFYEIISLYNSDGGDFIPVREEATDHIGSELNFVAKIAGEEIRAEKFDNQIQAEYYARLRYNFLDKHMLLWLPDFCREVNTKASTAFYRTVTDLTVYIVKRDYDNLHARFRSEQTIEDCS